MCATGSERIDEKQKQKGNPIVIGINNALVLSTVLGRLVRIDISAQKKKKKKRKK